MKKRLSNTYCDKNYVLYSVPYNFNNILVTKKDIEMILNKYDTNVKINDLEIYIRAFTHVSYTKKNGNAETLKDFKEKNKDKLDRLVELRDECNERLEFLGDPKIKGIIAEYLYDRYPTMDEGFMTTLKAKLENTSNFAKLARIIGLQRYILLSHYIEQKTKRQAESMLENAFEAFIGAMYKDLGYEVIKKFIINLLEEEVDFAEYIKKDDNYKTKILQYYHKRNWKPPQYVDLGNEEKNNGRMFVVGVLDNEGDVICSGRGYSKVEAEQQASYNAMVKFGQIKISD